ncbi:MAG: L,D-transpeptidase family protein [Marinobacterium sp.]|nr:L,D-transpeptidase family protein [Marinobacterium sp.]
MPAYSALRRCLLASFLLLTVSVTSFSQAARFKLAPQNSVIGELQLIPAAQGDTLVRLARQHNLGYQAIIQANQATDRWLPVAGTPVVLPTRFILPDSPRQGLVINLAEMRLYYYPKQFPGEVWSFPIGIGRQGWQTPVAKTQIHSRIANPRWTPPRSIREAYAIKGIELPEYIPPGPENPLGDHALMLTLPGYLLHGTNRPAGVGMRVSHGCIRLYPEDIAQLYQQVRAGTPVQIIDQSTKLGWQGNQLLLEVHTPAYAHTASDINRANQKRSLMQKIRQLNATTQIDWPAVRRIIQSANGVPGIIGIRHNNDEREHLSHEQARENTPGRNQSG